MNTNFKERFTNWLLADRPKQGGELEAYTGGSSVQFSGGRIFAGEFNPDLKGTNWAKTVEKMRREAQVSAGLRIIQLLIEAATFKIASSDKRVKEAAEEMLFKRLNFQQYLTHMLTAVPFGYEVLEKVWIFEDGMWWYEDLQHLGQQSIVKWIPDAVTGKLAGIEQRGYKGSSYGNFFVPSEDSTMNARFKLVHIATQQEGNNFEGISVLRPAYMFWWGKTTVFPIAGIALERFGATIPIIEPPIDETTGKGKFTPEEKDAAIEIGKQIRTGAQAQIWNPGGWKFGAYGAGESERMDPMPYLQYCDEEISIALLTEFLNLGRTQTGARSVGETQLDIFMLSEEALCDLITERTNQWVLDPWKELNFENHQDIDLKLVWSDLKANNPEALSRYLERLDRADLLDKDDPLRDHVREVGDLPPRPEAVAQSAHEHSGRRFFSGRRFVEDFYRELRPCEKSVAFREMLGREEDGEQAIVDVFEEVREAWTDELMQQIRVALEDGDISDVADIAIPKKQKEEKVGDVVAQLRELFAFGQRTVRDEEKRQKQKAGKAAPAAVALRDDDIEAEEITQLFKARSKRFLNSLSARIEAVAIEAAIGIGRTEAGDFDEAEILAIKKTLSTMFTETAALDARVLVSEAVSLGRNKEAEKKAADIQRVEYSAILDGEQCDICDDDDGTNVQMGTGEYYSLLPPNKECLSRASGSNRCRCIYVYVFEEN